MKKLVSMLSLTLLLSINLQAQGDSNTTTESRFGIKAGYSSLAIRVSFDGASASESASGFYVGGFADLYLSENLNLQPELTYANYSEDGASSDILLIPVLLKYMPAEEFGLLAGPQLDYLLNEEDGEGINRLGLGMAVGLSYDITDKVIIDTRYTFGLSNRLDDSEAVDFGVKAKFNYFQVGLAYRF